MNQLMSLSPRGFEELAARFLRAQDLRSAGVLAAAEYLICSISYTAALDVWAFSAALDVWAFRSNSTGKPLACELKPTFTRAFAVLLAHLASVFVQFSRRGRHVCGRRDSHIGDPPRLPRRTNGPGQAPEVRICTVGIEIPQIGHHATDSLIVVPCLPAVGVAASPRE
jgi:hypothetical protein